MIFPIAVTKKWSIRTQVPPRSDLNSDHWISKSPWYQCCKRKQKALQVQKQRDILVKQLYLFHSIVYAEILLTQETVKVSCAIKVVIGQFGSFFLNCPQLFVFLVSGLANYDSKDKLYHYFGPSSPPVFVNRGGQTIKVTVGDTVTIPCKIHNKGTLSVLFIKISYRQIR